MNEIVKYTTEGLENFQVLIDEDTAWLTQQKIAELFLIDRSVLGISQLRRADAGLVRRQEIAYQYNEAFKDISGIITPKISQDVYHAYHLYVIQIKDRLGLYNCLKENNIHAQVHYEPVHLQPYYKKLGNKLGDMPIAENFYQHCISLPMYPTLTDEEQEYVIKKMEEYIK
jgi:dTDP-4-amino-4,6-dideoxygalactose transaminase